MTKKVYLKPAIEVNSLDMNEQIMAGSVQTTGLGDNNLTEDTSSGDAWGDAMGRSNDAWDDGGW